MSNDIERSRGVESLQRSSHISGRRALFPVDSESDSDLGHMSPLGTDTNESDIESENDYIRSFKCTSDNDYLILGSLSTNVNKFRQKDVEKACEANAQLNNIGDTQMSPSKGHSAETDTTVIPDTPLKDPLYQDLKTPHDTSSTNAGSNAPKLIRKSHVDSTTNKTEFNKRLPHSPLSSPESKRIKLDVHCHKMTKVRTALFPEPDISVPVQSFYSKANSIKNERKFLNREAGSLKHKIKVRPLFLCNRGNRRGCFGQINAGVRHRIRKPKHKNPTKSQLLQAALKIIDNSPLNEYIKELANLKDKQVSEVKPTQIVPLKIDTNNEIKVQELDKRECSPPVDPNRKFFKSSRTKGTVTLNNKVKLQVNGTNISLLEKNHTRKETKRASMNFDITDLLENDESEKLIDNTFISSALKILEEDKENLNRNDCNIFLQPHSLENSFPIEQTLQRKKENEILSPISQMCDTTSGLALNSPKKVKNLTSILQGMPNVSYSENSNVFSTANKLHMDQAKLFPLFNKDFKVKKQEQKPLKKGHVLKQKFKSLAANQMLIDAGQKKFGPTQCHECNIVYNVGDPSEEQIHLNYHNLGGVFRFPGWKNERVVQNLLDARIILVRPTDSKVWWKKIKDLSEIINRDLGYYDMELNTENLHVLLYIQNKCIVGCIFAEPQKTAYRLLESDGVDFCSTESYPVKCGVSRIWVSPNYRQKGVATALLDSLRASFIFGCVLSENDIALSSPTDAGKMFAKKYFKTTSFLIYM